MDGATVEGQLDYFVKRPAVIRRLPSATGGWQGFCRITTKHPFFNTKYHTSEESAKSMSKVNVGEAPRSKATQRYPQLFNEEICFITPEENTSESQDVIQMATTDYRDSAKTRYKCGRTQDYRVE